MHICSKVSQFWKFLKISKKIAAVEKSSLSSGRFKYCHGKHYQIKFNSKITRLTNLYVNVLAPNVICNSRNWSITLKLLLMIAMQVFKLFVFKSESQMLRQLKAKLKILIWFQTTTLIKHALISWYFLKPVTWNG